jgi:hypothetical protein
LQRTKRDKAPGNRDQAAKIMAKPPADSSLQELVRMARLCAGLDRLNPRSWLALPRQGFTAPRPWRWAICIGRDRIPEILQPESISDYPML